MNSKKLNPKKLIIIIICAVVIVISSIVILLYTKAPKPYETFETYKENWEKQDFKAMYSLLSTEAKTEITEEDFIKRYETIYKGIEANNLKIEADSGEEEKKVEGENAKVSFSVAMDTLAGNVEIPEYNMTLKKEEIDNKNTWTVAWDEKLIFPELGPSDKVKVTTINPKRGEISDRNGKGLAINGTRNTIIIVPTKFNAVKDKALPEIAQILDISQDKIESLLKSSTNPEWAVPIVTLSTDDKEKAIKLTAIDGVQYQKSQGRVYPGGEAFGSLIGYIAPITAEEMDNHKNEGYTAQDKIGKLGLEQVYEKRLKGEKGGEIYIAKDGKDDDKIVIEKKEAKDGKNIKLSVDIDTQKKIYTEMKGEAGAATASNPKTGEILALVSSPSFDSNLY